jgi:hypothetical protein
MVCWIGLRTEWEIQNCAKTGFRCQDKLFFLAKLVPLRCEVAGAHAHSTCRPANKTVFFFRLLWPCIMNVAWRERNQQDATSLMFINKCLSLTVTFTVHTACVPAPHNHSHHYQCRTPYAAVHTLVLLMMGIMMPEACWDKRLIINIRLVHLVGFSLFTLKTVLVIPKWFHVKIYARLGYYGWIFLVVISYLRFGTSRMFKSQENKELPLHAAQYSRRAQISSYSRRKPEITHNFMYFIVT